jgi:hypothetical protein
MLEAHRLQCSGFVASEIVTLSNLSIKLPLGIIPALGKGIEGMREAVIQDRESSYIISGDEF